MQWRNLSKTGSRCHCIRFLNRGVAGLVRLFAGRLKKWQISNLEGTHAHGWSTSNQSWRDSYLVCRLHPSYDVRKTHFRCRFSRHTDHGSWQRRKIGSCQVELRRLRFSGFHQRERPLRILSQQKDNVSWRTVRQGSFQLQKLHGSNHFTDRGTFVFSIPPEVSLVTSPVAKTAFTIRNRGHHRNNKFYWTLLQTFVRLPHLPNPEALWPPLGVCSFRPKEGTEKIAGVVPTSDSEWRDCGFKVAGRTSISGVRAREGGRGTSPGLLWLFIWFLQYQENVTLLKLTSNI